jgi:alpha-beta hydrolase superfamily lysophospholipase
VQVESHIVNDIFARRFRGPDPRYALLISHGIGGHSGIYNTFCEHHASRGVDVWAYDAPGHGQSVMTQGRGSFTLGQWVDACVGLSRQIKAETGLPVIALGSSLGVAVSFCSLHSEAIAGAILMGAAAVPSADCGMGPRNPFRAKEIDAFERAFGRTLRLDIRRLINFDIDYGYSGAAEQKLLDPFNTWHYDMSAWRSFFTYDPEIPASRNEKPILYAAGDKDALVTPETIRKCAASISGPVTVEILTDAKHQLMLFETKRFSELIERWISNPPTAAALRPSVTGTR